MFINIFHSNHSLFILNRYVKFATAAYGDHVVNLFYSKIPFLSQKSWTHHRNHEGFSNHTEIPIEDIYFSSYSEYNSINVYHPKFYVVLDHKMKSVVVSIRGTLSLHDLLIDLTCEYDSISIKEIQGNVHSGIFSTAKQLIDPLVEHNLFNSIKDALNEYQDFNLILTGHSLGAGILFNFRHFRRL